MVAGFLFVLSLLLAAEAVVVDLNSDNFDQVWRSNVWRSLDQFLQQMYGMVLPK